MAAPAAALPAAYAGQRIVILGLARQGVALARYLALAGAQVGVSDQQPEAKLAEALAALDDLPSEYVLVGHPETLPPVDRLAPVAGHLCDGIRCAGLEDAEGGTVGGG